MVHLSLPMTDLYLDTETRSTVAIQRGTDLYTRNAKCLLVTYAFDDEPVRYWEPWDEITMPGMLREGLMSPKVNKIAQNGQFDRGIVRHALKVPTPLDSWECTMAQSYSHGLPGSLELQGLVLQLAEDEQKLAEDGKRLMRLFCIPGEGDAYVEPWDRPEEWRKFRDYGIRDTASMRAVRKKLPRVNYQNEHLELWHLDQRINQRGFQFDAQLARAAVDFLERAKQVTDAAVQKATGDAVQAVTQRNRLLQFLVEKYKIDLPNLRASEIREWLEHDDLDPGLRFLLEMRLEAGKSAGSKYKRGIGAVGPGGRMRCTIQFGGAGRTGRFSGRLFQPHNMARPVLTVRKEFGPDAGKMKLINVKAKYIDEVIIPGIYSGDALALKEVFGGPNEAAALALRHVIVAAPGNELVVADWSNIESRVLAWIADERWKLEAYRAVDRGDEGAVDLYKLLFSQFFGVAIDKITDTERQSGKVSELAFGFGGGVGALVTMAAGYQMDLLPLADMVLPRATPDQRARAYKSWRRAFLMREDYDLPPLVYQACDVLKQSYRASNGAIDQLKHDLDGCIKTAINEPGRAFPIGRCLVWSTRTFLIIQLPSGRRLLYANPRVEHEIAQDPDTLKPIHRDVVSYATARGKTWRRERAWSGLFVENIVQAIANDVLRGNLLRLHRDTLAVPAVAAYLATLPEEERTAICLHVHDEIVLDVPKGSYPLDRMIELITQPLSWAEGLPLSAEGWTGPRYGKR